MSFHENGELDEKPQQPEHRDWPEMRSHVNHIIPWETLRDFWNRLIQRHPAMPREQITGYIQIVATGYTKIVAGRFNSKLCDSIADAIRGGNVLDVSYVTVADRDALDQMLCWQKYNLFDGPRTGEGGYPLPPDRLSDHFKMGLASNFEFPPLAVDHVARASALSEACRHMEAFISSGAGFNQCVRELAAVADYDVIPCHDANWFHLDSEKWMKMGADERRRFFDACWDKTPGDRWSTDGNAVYAERFEGRP